MSTKLNRRIFLRGMGGAALAAPFLSSVWERTARGDTPAPGKALIVMFTHYGVITNKWFPTKTQGELTAADLEPTSLAALAPYAKKLLMPRGIRSMNEWTANMTRGQGNDSHTQIVGSFFTCQPVTPNSNDPFSFNQATKFNAKAVGPSLDHVIAQQLSPQGTPLLLNTAGQNDGAQSAISYKASETLFSGLNASQAFSSLTGLFQSGQPMSPDSYAAVRGKSVLDLVKDDLQTLERFDMSSADKQKLAAWKELVNSTGNVMVSAQCNAELGEMLGATSANASKAASGGFGTDVLTTKVAGDLDGADIYSAIAALAAACNANPVIFMKYPGNYNFKGLGITMESHSLSHRLDNAGMSGSCLPNAIEMLLKVDAYYAQKFANLVKMLDSIPSGSGTVLDSVAAIWFNEMSDGNAHNLNNAPIIQAGSAGGYFKTGQIINVDPASTPTAGNSMSQCANGTGQVNGVNQGTGTDPKIGNAPINKYFCNIMNALGVKAGADGFPAKGGSAEVTHFGYSDKTEDFIGGKGAREASIHNPGGFAELKA
ncbi:Tat pathway signal sequence [Sorangium cellulosum]|uniref:Tat pathway signal sequence n=1 Tax=Sorangium cellulosum TaxID=56 RepID=A0A150T4G7_SORCE|nr:Tat pathway signal sequence [Sorangium cellulosum]KYF99625.1 Tat pathway signal sequence [Sorangium cellulosum]